MPHAENIGFVIPTPILAHFMKDIKINGKYTGFGHVGIQCQPLDNKQLRKFYKVPEEKVIDLFYVTVCSRD